MSLVARCKRCDVGPTILEHTYPYCGPCQGIVHIEDETVVRVVRWMRAHGSMNDEMFESLERGDWRKE